METRSWRKERLTSNVMLTPLIPLYVAECTSMPPKAPKQGPPECTEGWWILEAHHVATQKTLREPSEKKHIARSMANYFESQTLGSVRVLHTLIPLARPSRVAF